MIVGFSGFGFPKAHGAAFGLLAYQSTWLRVHYGPEFLSALLNEQPMGFYASDTLSHEAQRRGIEMLPPDVNASQVECMVVPPATVPPLDTHPPPQPHCSGRDRTGLERSCSGRDRTDLERGAPAESEKVPNRVRIGLGYVLGARDAEVEALVDARREGGPFRSLADLASRAGAGRPALEKLAWAGACDALGPRGLGAPAHGAVAARRGRAGRGGARGHAAGAAARGARPRRRSSRWPRGSAMVADYATTGLTLGPHPMALLRPRCRAGRCRSRTSETARARDARCASAAWSSRASGPGTAKGIVFMLLEDEFGTINLIVPPPVYERHRLTVRTEPLMMAEGRLERLAERRRGDQRLWCATCEPLVAPEDDGGRGRRAGRAAAAAAAAEGSARAGAESPAAVAAAAAGNDGEPAEGAAADFRGVAPAVQSFAAGRRR